jgi:hypothetical protein
MILYHRTTAEAARLILESGFKDATGHYMTDLPWTGVWVSDEPLDANEGACGDTLLEITTDLSETDMDEYCWREEGKMFREYLIPAATINAHMSLRLVEGSS